MSVERKWLPELYSDEIVPPPRATPSDWIVSLPGDAFALAPCGFEVDEPEPPYILRAGAVVKFQWTESYEDLVVDFSCDPPRVVSGTLDPRANCFMADHEMLCESIELLAEDLKDFGAKTEAPIDVRQDTWSDNIDFRFEITPDGPRFVEVTIGGSAG